MHDILTQQCVATSTYINARTVFMRCKLLQGRYVIIPTTFRPQTLGDYMIRVFTSVDSHCRELIEDKPRVRCWSSFLGYPQALTHVYVHRAEGLQNQDSTGGADPYVIISCEGQSVKSIMKKDTLQPEFGTSAIFYRKNPRKPITVEVWNNNSVKDEFMGQVVLSGSVKDTTDPQKLKLRKQGQTDEMPGSISLRIITSTQLTAMWPCQWPNRRRDLSQRWTMWWTSCETRHMPLSSKKQCQLWFDLFSTADVDACVWLHWVEFYTIDCTLLNYLQSWQVSRALLGRLNVNVIFAKMIKLLNYV